MKNYGFIPSKIEGEHYILGGGQLPKIILQPDRNWKPYLPRWESQIDKFDTFGCTVFGTLNAIETLLGRLNFKQYDYSERYNYILAGITPPGADPHYVTEIIRKYGVIEQVELPFTDTLEEFMKPKPMTSNFFLRGREWLDQYNFGHEWVFVNTPNRELRTALVREALQYSPLCVSVTAWYEENGLFVDQGLPNTHWTLCYGVDEDGGLLIFDSYNFEYKKLHPDHKVMMAKRYYIEAKKVEEKLSWIGRILQSIGEALGLIEKKVNELPPLKVVYPESLMPKRDLINEVCEAIKEYEGFWKGSRSERNNNPGNIKGTDGRFLIFQTYADGWNYLVDYVTRACTGKHTAYRPDMSILDFFKVYAPSSDNNEPKKYADFVSKKLQVSVTMPIKDLL